MEQSFLIRTSKSISAISGQKRILDHKFYDSFINDSSKHLNSKVNLNKSTLAISSNDIMPSTNNTRNMSSQDIDTSTRSNGNFTSIDKTLPNDSSLQNISQGILLRVKQNKLEKDRNIEALRARINMLQKQEEFIKKKNKFVQQKVQQIQWNHEVIENKIKERQRLELLRQTEVQAMGLKIKEQKEQRNKAIDTQKKILEDQFKTNAKLQRERSQQHEELRGIIKMQIEAEKKERRQRVKQMEEEMKEKMRIRNEEIVMRCKSNYNSKVEKYMGMVNQRDSTLNILEKLEKERLENLKLTIANANESVMTLNKTENQSSQKALIRNQGISQRRQEKKERVMSIDKTSRNLPQINQQSFATLQPL